MFEVKKKEVIRLLDKIVFPLISEPIINQGFKYLKSKRKFERKLDGYHHFISFSHQKSEIFYDENLQKLILTFNLLSTINLPDYNKWYRENFEQSNSFNSGISNCSGYIELSGKDFVGEDMNPEKAEKELIEAIKSNRQLPPGDVQINGIIAKCIPEMLRTLDTFNSPKNVFDAYPHKDLFLLIYAGHNELAKPFAQKRYNDLISVKHASGWGRDLEEFISKIEKVTDWKFLNPYKRSIKISECKNHELVFSAKSKFIERLRLDISQFNIKTIEMDDKGNLFLLMNDKTIFKFDHTGKLVFENKPKTVLPFAKRYSNYPASGYISQTNVFYISNYILTSTNELIELEVPIEKDKQGYPQIFPIQDFAYWQEQNKYMLLFGNSIFIYSTIGKLEKTIKVNEGHPLRIIEAKQWIISQELDKENIISNFDGDVLHRLKLSNGNSRLSISDNHEYLLSFFYSSKSDFSNLATSESKTIWAHPTYMKGYKETLYNNVNHNFGMLRARFAPDNQYLVTSADHGKYVAWDLPKVIRKELIPNQKALELLKPYSYTETIDSKRHEVVSKPEVIQFNNETYLNNRNNGISNIFFLENGDIFITEIGELLLIWDRDFNNIDFIKLDLNLPVERIHGSRIKLHNDNYLTVLMEKELVIYEKSH